MAVTDFLDDETGDIACVKGDFAIGDATLQHQGDLLQAYECEYKQSPTTGIGIEDFCNSEDPTEMLRKVRQQFISDGMKIIKMKYNGNLNIKAVYK